MCFSNTKSVNCSSNYLVTCHAAGAAQYSPLRRAGGNMLLFARQSFGPTKCLATSVCRLVGACARTDFRPYCDWSARRFAMPSTTPYSKAQAWDVAMIDGYTCETVVVLLQPPLFCQWLYIRHALGRLFALSESINRWLILDSAPPCSL